MEKIGTVKKIESTDIVCKCGTVNNTYQEDGLIKCVSCGHEWYTQVYYEKHREDLICSDLTQEEISEVIDKQLAEETKSEIIVIGGGADVKRNIKRYLDKNKTYEITIKEVISIN